MHPLANNTPEPTGVNAPSARTVLIAFGGLMASLSAGYGVLFTIVDDYRADYGISESAIGIVIGIGFLAGFLSQIAVAPYADRGHAKKVVILGVLVSVIGLLTMAMGTSLTPILIGRFVSGIGIGAASPAVKRIVILADPANLGENVGKLIAAEVFGFAMGPAVSAMLVGPFGIPAPFIVVSVLTLVLLPFVARVPVGESTEPQAKRLALDLLSNRPFAGAVAMGAAVFVMIGAFDTLWAVVHRDLGTTEWVANIGITIFAMPLVLLGPAGGRLAQTFGPFRLAVIGLLAGAGFMFIYGQMPSGGLIFSVAMVHAISDGLTVSASGVAVGMVVPENRLAGAQGVLGAAEALAAGIAAALTGYAYQHAGRTVAYALSAGLMLALVGLGVWLSRSAWSINRPLRGPLVADSEIPAG